MKQSLVLVVVALIFGTGCVTSSMTRSEFMKNASEMGYIYDLHHDDLSKVVDAIAEEPRYPTETVENKIAEYYYDLKCATETEGYFVEGTLTNRELVRIHRLDANDFTDTKSCSGAALYSMRLQPQTCLEQMNDINHSYSFERRGLYTTWTRKYNHHVFVSALSPFDMKDDKFMMFLKEAYTLFVEDALKFYTEQMEIINYYNKPALGLYFNTLNGLYGEHRTSICTATLEIPVLTANGQRFTIVFKTSTLSYRGSVNCGIAWAGDDYHYKSLDYANIETGNLYTWNSREMQVDDLPRLTAARDVFPDYMSYRYRAYLRNGHLNVRLSRNLWRDVAGQKKEWVDDSFILFADVELKAPLNWYNDQNFDKRRWDRQSSK